MVGSHCEVVIHDLSDPEHSVVSIAGDLTGRSVGAPVPDLSFISGQLSQDTPDQLNYCATIEDQHLQSTTVWIKDQDGEPVGAVCINMDYSALIQARQLIDQLIQSTQQVSDLTVRDTFARDLDHLIELSVTQFVAEKGINGVRELQTEDKLALMETLENRGLFRIRGAVNKVAALLNISRSSIYNYRSSVRSE